MANPTSNIIVVLTLFASGNCFMSTLIDGPLKAAYSMFGNQGGRAAVASPTAYRQMSALAPTVVGNQKQNGAIPNHIVVHPDHSDNKLMGGYNNKPMGQPLMTGDWNNGQSSDSQDPDGSWNRKQIKMRKQIGNSYKVGSSQYGDSSQNEKSWQKMNSWQNIKDTDLLQDWAVDSDEVVQGLLVKPASDLVIIAQPANPTTSHGVMFRQSGGSLGARRVFESL